MLEKNRKAQLATESTLMLKVCLCISVCLNALDLPMAATPTKSEDDLGVATPDLVLTSRNNEGLAVEGEGFLGQYSPLSHASLEDKLAME